MRFSTAFATVAAVTPLVSAHGNGPAIPKISGLNMRDLKARSLMDSIKARAAELAQEAHAHGERGELKPRQGGTDGQCGEGKASCATGYCCSASGWCGNTADYCYSPGCQYQFGPACNENKTPAGADTASVSRSQLGSVPYGGEGIYQCTEPGTVALTFDDGPYQEYTDHVLDLFKSYNAKGTFFITGANINKGQIDTTTAHVNTIKRMANEGHQIASHTWTHLDLSAISETERRAQMTKLEMAMRNIVGYFPTYMRPPYSSCTAASGCAKTMSDLGYSIIYFDVDTDDYNQLEASQIQNAKDNFKGNLTANGATPANSEHLAIAHDIHPQTANNLTEFMLSTLTDLGYKAVTVGECLGDPKANWYRSSTGSTPSPSNPPTATATSSQKVSTDGTCAGTSGFTCQGSSFGNCCSQYGWCGSTTDHCNTGCQSTFGTCSGGSSPAQPTPTKAATPSPTATAKVSTDGTCAGTAGLTCQGSSFGNCCSQYGWCGSTTDHCGTGCNNSFGTCS